MTYALNYIGCATCAWRGYLCFVLLRIQSMDNIARAVAFASLKLGITNRGKDGKESGI